MLILQDYINQLNKEVAYFKEVAKILVEEDEK